MFFDLFFSHTTERTKSKRRTKFSPITYITPRADANFRVGPFGRVVGVVVGGRCGVGVGRRFPAAVAGGSPVDRAVAGAAPPDADPVLRVVPPVPDVTLGGTLADADPARYDFVSVVHAVTLEARRAAHLCCCLFFYFL